MLMNQLEIEDPNGATEAKSDPFDMPKLPPTEHQTWPRVIFIRIFVADDSLPQFRHQVHRKIPTILQ